MGLIQLVVLCTIGFALADVQIFDGGRVKRGAPFTGSPRWSLPVPYTINDDFNADQKSIIQRGIQSIMDNTCIDFKEDATVNPRLVYIIVTGSMCSSAVGDQRFERVNHTVKLTAPGCTVVGKVQHETSHAIGITHTQNRADRDKYLIVNMDNVRDNKKGNFEIIPPQESPIYVPFEYGSRMMYSPYEMGKTSDPILTPLDDSYFTSMGTAPELTFYDFKNLNMLYNCSQSCTSPVNCQNGGYRHPRDCNRCSCPDFFDGKNCETERGLITLRAAANPAILVINTTGGHAFADKDQFDWTYFTVDPLHVIKAPANARIRITIEPQSSWAYLTDGQANACRNGNRSICDSYAVQLSEGDLAFAGKKFCCVSHTLSFVSNSNVIGYRAYAHKSRSFASKVTFSIEPETGSPTTLAATTTATTTSKPVTSRVARTVTTTTTTTTPKTSTITTTAKPATITTTLKPSTTTTVPPTTTKPVTTTTTIPITTTKQPTVAPITTTTTAKPPSFTATVPKTAAPITDAFVCEY